MARTPAKAPDRLLVSPRTAAAMLDVSRDLIYQLVNAGELGEKHYMGSGRHMYHLEHAAVVAYAKSRPHHPIGSE